MIINISKQELSLLYNKAEAKYYECINKKDNKFLEEEISVSLASIEVKKTNIKVVFSQDEKGYVFEISLMLLIDSHKVIGKYMYSEDKNGSAVDDSLVFF